MPSLALRAWCGLLAFAVAAVAFGCTSPHPNVDPHGPGDACLDDCPEGMRCRGVHVTKSPYRTHPGACELLDGRCVQPSDCPQPGQCVRPGERIGLCAPGFWR